jgi:putative phosphoribosyl transferase
MRFSDREEAGRQLASRLLGYKDEAPIVLGLPRGGVPVAYEVAKALGAPLDLWVVRKVGAPGFQEYGLGAVAEGGIVYLNSEAVEEVGASPSEVREIVLRKTADVAERAQRLRGGQPPPRVEGRTVILVDDGIATGGTVRAAIQSLRCARPRRIVLAVPVAASQALEELQELADDIVCVLDTPSLYAIGAWYENFQQVPDEEVVRLLERARADTSLGMQPSQA